MGKTTFSGVIAPLPTPFERDGSVDWFALTRLFERQADAGNGVAALSHLSETRAMDEKERQAVIGEGAAVLEGRSAFFVCIDPRAGAKAAELALEAEAAGSDGLIVSAGCERLEGYFGFVKKLRACCRLPLCLCRGEGRGSLPLFAELASFEGVEAVAECGEKPGEALALEAAWNERRRALSGQPYFLSANESLAVLCEALGEVGIISPTAALLPREMAAAWRKRGRERRAALERLSPFFDLFSSSGAPAALKWALQSLGVCSATVRLPYIEPDAEERRRIEGCIARLGRV